jgi:hypothetical protein
MSENGQEKENEQREISLEEAKFVITSQLTVYQHIRDQTLRLFRILIAAIAVVITGLSIVTPFNFGFVPSLRFVVSSSVENYGFSRLTVQLLLAIQPTVILSSFALMFSSLFMSILYMRKILTGPGLKPDIGAEVNPRFLDVVRPIEEQEWYDWRGDSNRYKDWISHNSRGLDVLRRREHQMYSNLTLFLVGAIVLVVTALFYLNRTIVALSVLEIFGFLLFVVTRIARRYENKRTRNIIIAAGFTIVLIVFFGAILFS